MSMRCLDWDDADPLIIKGKASGQDYKAIDIGMIPCNSGETVDSQCETDLAKQIEYLDDVSLVTLANYEIFDPYSFGEDSIIREAKF